MFSRPQRADCHSDVSAFPPGLWIDPTVWFGFPLSGCWPKMCYEETHIAAECSCGAPKQKKKEATPRQNSLPVSSARGQSAESNACLTIKILKVVLQLKKVPGKFKGSPLPADPSSFREYKLLVQPRESWLWSRLTAKFRYLTDGGGHKVGANGFNINTSFLEEFKHQTMFHLKLRANILLA